MQDIREFIDVKKEAIEEHMKNEAYNQDGSWASHQFAHEFIDDYLSGEVGKDVAFTLSESIEDIAEDMADDKRMYNSNLYQWLNSNDHEAEHYINLAVQEGYISTENFDIIKAMQIGMTNEIEESVRENIDYIKSCVAAKYMLTQGYTKAEPDFIENMGQMIDADDISQDALKSTFEYALERTGYTKETVGEKETHDQKKDFER